MKIIPLTQDYVAWVDDCDYKRLARHKWYVNRRGRCWYAVRSAYGVANSGPKTILMHREILNAEPEQQVDHIWGESSPGIIHNWRANLRLCSPAQNQQGFHRKKKGASSRFRGVYWAKHAQKWCARIRVGDRMWHLGLFDIEEDAAHAYDVAAREHFGEFASPNFK